MTLRFLQVENLQYLEVELYSSEIIYQKKYTQKTKNMYG